MSGRVEAAALAAVLAVAAVLFAAVLDSGPNYDEGVYLATADALAGGGELGTEVFTSQPPGFPVLLRTATAVPGDSVDSSRVLFVLVALGGVAAAWALARTLVSPTAGIAAAAMLAVAPAYAINAARVSADVPALALALAGLAVLALARERESTWGAVAAGAMLTLAVGVKLLAAVALVPALLLARRFRLATAAAAGGAVAAAVLLAPFGPALDDIWADAVGFHNDARKGSLAENAETVALALQPRLAWGLLVLLAAAAALARRDLLRRTAPLWLWTAAAIVFLAWHRPLLDHHFALLAAAASVAAGATLGGLVDRLRGRAAAAAAAALALLVAGAAVQHWRAAGRLAPPSADVARAAEAVRDTTVPGEPVATDLPIVAHLADRTVPGPLVDTSAVRFEAGSLEPEDVLEVADEEGVRVVVVGRMFRAFPALLAGLERRFPQARRVGGITLLVRGRAAARAAQRAARG